MSVLLLIAAAFLVAWFDRLRFAPSLSAVDKRYSILWLLTSGELKAANAAPNDRGL